MRRILGLKALFAFVGALMLMTQAASAHHVVFDFTLSSYATNAYADSTSYIYFGANRAASMEIQLPDGWRVAHADATTSPFTPPNNGENVGNGTATARWQPFGCNAAETDRSLTATWDSTPSGGPAGTVAQVTITAGSLFSTQAYVVLNAGGDYDIEVPDMPDTFVCSSTTAGAMTLTLKGSISTSRKMAQNPSTTGVKTANVSYVDTGGTTHATSDSVTIV